MLMKKLLMCIHKYVTKHDQTKNRNTLVNEMLLIHFLPKRDELFSSINN